MHPIPMPNALSNPRLTVITVSYNAKETIEQTILSVAAQSAEGIEYLVIDGASSDGTADVLRRHSHHIDHWVSEPDNGIYDAMNKGIAMARGEWIMFLNADDYFENERSAQYILEATDDLIDVVSGQTLMKYAHHECIFRPSQRFGLMLQLPFMHPSTIVRRSTFQTCGHFDTRYRIAADCDFFLRLISRGYNHRSIQEIVTVMRDGGASQRGFVRGRIEYMQSYWRNMRDPIGAFLGFTLSMALHIRSKLRSLVSQV